MSQPTYPLFSKRVQPDKHKKREKYNFQKSNEYDLAEKWFEERKSTTKTYDIVTPSIRSSTQHASQSEPIKTKRVPPGLEISKRQYEDCELDIIIPSYDNFNYINPDDLIYTAFQKYNIITVFKKENSTPLLVIEDEY